mgnify:CR=1 FL=1
MAIEICEAMKHIKLSPISLKNHKDINEVWIHERIAEDPTILGLGDVIVKDRERIHPGAGRLDLLLQDTDGQINGAQKIMRT